LADCRPSFLGDAAAPEIASRPHERGDMQGLKILMSRSLSPGARSRDRRLIRASLA